MASFDRTPGFVRFKETSCCSSCMLRTVDCFPAVPTGRSIQSNQTKVRVRDRVMDSLCRAISPDMNVLFDQHPSPQRVASQRQLQPMTDLESHRRTSIAHCSGVQLLPFTGD